MTENQQLFQQLFPEMKKDDIDALCDVATPCLFPAGVDVCQEGAAANTLYIVGTGQVDIIVHAAESQEIVVDSIEGPTYFGEMALLGETTRSATIRTRTPCRMLEITRQTFLNITDENPGLLRRMLRQIIGHLRRNDRAVIQALNGKHAELHHAYAELAEQEQLRTQFIATLSHELRTPLTAVQGYVSLLNKGALNGNSLNIAMTSITRNVETLVGLTNQMMLLYEMFPEKPETIRFKVAELVQEALDEVRETAQDKETAVTFHAPTDLPMLEADRRTLYLAFRAILENAFKYNPHKAPIVIKAYQSGFQEIAIAVQDQGIGIPAWAHERIFDPFYRLEQEGSQHLFPGIGVGLTIAKLLSARQNGRVTVQSQPGKGSTFTIFLPTQ